MKWFKHLLGRSEVAESRIQSNVRFLGEQDGDIERELKARWIAMLVRNAGVRRAYLPIVSYDGGSTYQPALCLTHATGGDVALVDALAEPFRQMFHKSQALDIMFLRPEQEEQLAKVCRPFYLSDQPPRR